ncbi:hypothetical protein OHB12_13710 [Nocardia sp. NBC_01730]|nr:hypothetical protein OHB12_13710 [Nocardia sp. NBC_01730]
MTEHIAGVAVPESRLVAEATELVRDSAPPLLFVEVIEINPWLE